jgi:hypothetical protein
MVPTEGHRRAQSYLTSGVHFSALAECFCRIHLEWTCTGPNTAIAPIRRTDASASGRIHGRGGLALDVEIANLSTRRVWCPEARHRLVGTTSDAGIRGHNVRSVVVGHARYYGVPRTDRASLRSITSSYGSGA